MTWTTTHIGMSTILLFILSPKKLREELRENPKLFFVFSIAAILPDSDAFFLLHRSLFHSIFFPLFFMLLAPLIKKYRNTGDNFVRNVNIFGLMWISHTLFDLAFSGGIALFWPIDTRFYDVTMGIRINFDPLLITGFFLKIKHIDESIAIDSYIVNQDAATRVETFGRYLDFPIVSLPLHAAIFFVWFFLVFVPYMKFRRKVREENRITSMSKFNNLSLKSKVWFIITIPYTIIATIFYFTIVIIDNSFMKIKKTMQNDNNQIFPIFLLITIIMSCLYAGPYQGKEWISEEEYSDQYVVLTDFYLFNGVRTFSVPNNAELNVTLFVYNTTIDFSIFAISMDFDQANETKWRYDQMLEEFYDENITGSQLINGYQLDLYNTMQINADDGTIKNVTRINEATIQFLTKEDITILSGLYYWNSSEYFAKTIYTIVSYTYTRVSSYLFGIIFAIVFFGILVILLIRFQMQK